MELKIDLRPVLYFIIVCVVAACVITFGIGWWIASDSNEPTALDVYRGKTELLVTSVNGVPTDSVVVFKK